MDIMQELSLIGIVPVIKIEDAAKAAPLAEALCRGGLPAAEVTYRTAAAGEAIRAMRAAEPKMLIGAGTVLTVAQVDDALAAGAQFIVSPGLNPNVVRHCLERGVPVIPGINNPTGIEAALELGLDTVKFFPAEPSGGLKMLKAMAAPYGGVRFMPTGGLSPANVGAYLAWDRIFACGGSWMVPADLLETGDFASIEKLTREAVDTMLGLHFDHLGVNLPDEAECAAVADRVSALFSLPEKEMPASVFAGVPFEFMKAPGRGRCGHVSIGTPDVERAMYHLARRGAAFDTDSIKRNEKGKATFVYLKDEIGGFSYHIVERK